MGKLYDNIIKQQKEHPNEEVIEIYEFIKELNGDGKVWSGQWNMLTDVTFKGWPSDIRWYRPSKLWNEMKLHFNKG